MDRRGIFSVSIVCLVITLAVASVVGSNSGVPSLGTSGANSPKRRNASVPSSLVPEDVIPDSRGERELVERGDNLRLEHQVEQQVEQQVGEEKKDYDGEDEDEDDWKSDGASDGKNDDEGEDEYEDELKAVAESHEAMLRDDSRNSNTSTATSTFPGLLDWTSTGSKNFHSREVITVSNSDEDVASNETITDEIVDKYDREVVELLKYTKQHASRYDEGNRTKTKRVPTVKKELSTQKEILIGNNETQVPKSVLPPEDPANRLNEETDAIQRRNVGSDESAEPKDRSYPESSEREEEILGSSGYQESRTKVPKKLDKRQKTALQKLQSFLLTEYTNEVKQRQKLHEQWAQEDTLVEKLLQLLAKVTENPERSDREQELHANSEDDPKISIAELDQAKRSYDSTPSLFTNTSQSETDKSTKSGKKLKKKKKKSSHIFFTTTSMLAPATPSLLTTTETPWQTTSVQWRLVAERLFSPPTWPQDLPGEKTTSPRFSAQQSARSLAATRELIEQNKSRSNPKTYLPDRKPILSDQIDELGNQRLMRFGKIAAPQPGHVQPREFASVYDRPTDVERVPDYDIPEPYHRSRYNQLPPTTREYLRRLEEEDQGDLNTAPFRRDQKHQSQPRDFTLSKSWPDLSYGYNPSWRTEERPLLPRRQPTSDVKYWPQRGSFLPVNKSYWSALKNEEQAEQEADAEKMLQQQRVQNSWNRDRSNWSVEKPLKVPLPWQQEERPMKQYDRDQNGVWEGSKNRSESSSSTLKEENKEKAALSQITMKTWNSLTSDPATWPHKLPGAKPWPKDKNGKSYNPNADLVKKLGLDQQSGGTWAKEDVEKSNGERKSKDEKQNSLFAKEEKLARSDVKYKPNDDRSNFSDYKARSGESMKPWTALSDSKDSKEWPKSEDMQGDDAGDRRRKYEKKNSWAEEVDDLPKIQSMNAWVMTADQSTWKPYQMKRMDPSDENGTRRWAKSLGRSNSNVKWTSKESQSEKANDSWMDQSNITPQSEKSSVSKLWSEKPGKPSSGFAKTKDPNNWSSKKSNSRFWKFEDGWRTKPETIAWLLKLKNESSWTSKTNDDVSKFNGDLRSAKMKEEDPGDTWARKSNEQNRWNPKANELMPWQQMNDAWSYRNTSSTSMWSTKWKQFAYHKVTAMPISKPGTTADAASSKSKNAFVAVSAVSSPKYTGNDYRKSEDDTGTETSSGDKQVLRGGSTKDDDISLLSEIDF